jgi:hypothetical protein
LFNDEATISHPPFFRSSILRFDSAFRTLNSDFRFRSSPSSFSFFLLISDTVLLPFVAAERRHTGSPRRKPFFHTSPAERVALPFVADYPTQKPFGLKGLPMKAQGKAAERPPPWVPAPYDLGALKGHNKARAELCGNEWRELRGCVAFDSGSLGEATQRFAEERNVYRSRILRSEF